MPDRKSRPFLYPPDIYADITDYNVNEFKFGKHMAIGAISAMHPRYHWMLMHKKKAVDGTVTYPHREGAKTMLEEACAMSENVHNIQVQTLKSVLDNKINYNINQMPQQSALFPTVEDSGLNAPMPPKPAKKENEMDGSKSE